jgi:hypothetical protein
MNFDDHMAEWKKEKLRRREVATTKLKQSLADRPDISRIFVAYDGCGDSGCFEGHEYFDSEGKAVCADFLNDEVDEYACSILPVGWEIDDGSYGIVEIELALGEASVKHSDRTVEESFMEHEF